MPPDYSSERDALSMRIVPLSDTRKLANMRNRFTSPDDPRSDDTRKILRELASELNNFLSAENPDGPVSRMDRLSISTKATFALERVDEYARIIRELRRELREARHDGIW